MDELADRVQKGLDELVQRGAQQGEGTCDRAANQLDLSSLETTALPLRSIKKQKPNR